MESTARKEAIIQLRKSLHVSQARLVQAVNLSQSSISVWEQGYTELPEATVIEMGRFLMEERSKLAALNFPKFATQEAVTQ